MDDRNIDASVQEVLSSIAQNICNTCEAYALSFAEAWDLPEETRFRIEEVASTTEAFMLGLTQWIVSRGVESELKASVRSFMTYRTGSELGDDDIVSLAIRFKPDPVIRPDPHGLVKLIPSQPSSAEKECAQSSNIPKRVRDRVLVDDILRTQADSFETCMADSSALLYSAGYDTDSYRSWVLEESGRYAAAT
jgi:hypothetical protein